MNLQGKRVLVTGAGGFIGSHLAERLVESGARVRAFVHYRGDGSRGWLDESPHSNDIEIFAGDISDRDCVDSAVKGVEVVFHLAALIGIPYSYAAPASYVRTNIEGTLNVLQASRNCGIERIIHTSTSEVYGTARYVPIDEKHPLQGQSPYSATKIGADKIAEAFHLSFGTPVVTLRPFNTFGPRQTARAVIPTIISQCLAGDVVRLGSVHPMRDFNYVGDTVNAFLKCAEVASAVGRTIHVGSGREIQVGALAEKIAHLVGKSVRVETQVDRVRPEGSEVERLLADNSYAKTILDWEPTLSLDEGLRRTIAWIREHAKIYQPNAYNI